MLPLDLGMGQRFGQSEAIRLVGQSSILAEPTLDLASCAREAGSMVTGRRDPMDWDFAISAEGERLGCTSMMPIGERRLPDDSAKRLCAGR